MDQIDKNIILTDAQHGFRKRRACESQPIITINDIASKLKRNIKVDIILQDIAIAFDEVPFHRLLHSWKTMASTPKPRNG